jgi:hypothetical protein
MNARTDQPAFELHPRAPLRLRVDAGRHISAVAGTAWITIDGDLRDIILEPGDTHAFERPAHVMVQALGGDAQLVAEEGVEVESAHPVADAWHALWQRLQRTDLG